MTVTGTNFEGNAAALQGGEVMVGKTNFVANGPVIGAVTATVTDSVFGNNAGCAIHGTSLTIRYRQLIHR